MLAESHEDLFLEIIPEKVFMRKFLHKKWQKNFPASLGKFGQKSFPLPNISLLLHL